MQFCVCLIKTINLSTTRLCLDKKEKSWNFDILTSEVDIIFKIWKNTGVVISWSLTYKKKLGFIREHEYKGCTLARRATYQRNKSKKVAPPMFVEESLMMKIDPPPHIYLIVIFLQRMRMSVMMRTLVIRLMTIVMKVMIVMKMMSKYFVHVFLLCILEIVMVRTHFFNFCIICID